MAPLASACAAPSWNSRSGCCSPPAAAASARRGTAAGRQWPSTREGSSSPGAASASLPASSSRTASSALRTRPRWLPGLLRVVSAAPRASRATAPSASRMRCRVNSRSEVSTSSSPASPPSAGVARAARAEPAMATCTRASASPASGTWTSASAVSTSVCTAASAVRTLGFCTPAAAPLRPTELQRRPSRFAPLQTYSWTAKGAWHLWQVPSSSSTSDTPFDGSHMLPGRGSPTVQPSTEVMLQRCFLAASPSAWCLLEPPSDCSAMTIPSSMRRRANSVWPPGCSSCSGISATM
mmetsp:Transcript_31182/g.99485  ORF Transcript_31182/g.99485 Transcript_31182/m.99485 type:complete len:295 (-) Transcript_31182:404-1288(-)